jgi:hypothetical protein
MKRKLTLSFLLCGCIVIALMAGLFATQSVFAQCPPNDPKCPTQKPEQEKKKTKTPTIPARTKTFTPTETPTLTETPSPTQTPTLTYTPEWTPTPNSTEIAAFHTKYPLENQADTNPLPDPNPNPPVDQPSLFGGGVSLNGILIGLLTGILIGLLTGILIGMLLPAVSKGIFGRSGIQATSPFIKGDNSAFHKDAASPFIKGDNSAFHKDAASPFIKGENSAFHKDVDSPFIKGEGNIGEDNPFHKD